MSPLSFQVLVVLNNFFTTIILYCQMLTLIPCLFTSFVVCLITHLLCLFTSFHFCVFTSILFPCHFDICFWKLRSEVYGDYHLIWVSAKNMFLFSVGLEYTQTGWNQREMAYFIGTTYLLHYFLRICHVLWITFL